MTSHFKKVPHNTLTSNTSGHIFFFSFNSRFNISYAEQLFPVCFQLQAKHEWDRLNKTGECYEQVVQGMAAVKYKKKKKK